MNAFIAQNALHDSTWWSRSLRDSISFASSGHTITAPAASAKDILVGSECVQHRSCAGALKIARIEYALVVALVHEHRFQARLEQHLLMS